MSKEIGVILSSEFDLEFHLPHLLRRAHFKAESVFPEVYGPLVTSRQLALMVTVAKYPGLTQMEAATVIGLDANTCSDLVRRACERGWVTKTKAPTDRRAVRLALTPSGLELVLKQALPLAKAYTTEVCSRLEKKEQVELTRLLRKMLGMSTEQDAPSTR